VRRLFSWSSSLVLKYKKFLVVIFLIWGFWTFGLGLLGGLFLTKGGLDILPEIKNEDRVLILAPHIDDETIGAGGLIQRALGNKAKVKVVYFTNGDDNLLSAVEEERKTSVSSDEFITLGETRMQEGGAAMKILGLGNEDLIFLGYPDRGLLPMLGKYYTAPFTSRGTKFNHSPYRDTYKLEELYTGENLQTDLQEIVNSFKPTIIIVSHPRDGHPDHRAVFQYLERVLNGKHQGIRVFAYLVHFSLYPPEKKLQKNLFLFPPKRLFTKVGWFSLELSETEENKKLDAIGQYKSQKSPKFYDFLDCFVKRNEIFEEF